MGWRDGCFVAVLPKASLNTSSFIEGFSILSINASPLSKDFSSFPVLLLFPTTWNRKRLELNSEKGYLHVLSC